VSQMFYVREAPNGSRPRAPTPLAARRAPLRKTTESSPATPRTAPSPSRFPSQEAVNRQVSAQLRAWNTEHLDVHSTADEVAAAVARLCRGEGLRSVAQPIVRLTDMTVVGYEALTRVADPEGRSIQWWLDRASEHGMRSKFEVACWRSITRIGNLPDDVLLFANVSPTTLLEPELWLLRGAMPARLVIELTEQAPVDDYHALRDELAPWLASGARIAIDDTGAGYSSLRHVIELMPDFLKLDRAMVTDIDRDRNRLALVRSLVAFAREVGTSVIAEGIERVEELETARTAGVAYGQGYLLARPGPPWPALAEGQTRRVSAPGEDTDAHTVQRQVRLHETLRGARNAHEACMIVVDHIFGEGAMMPSLYLEHDGRLRCVAQRGLWQVLDGLSGDAGVTGRTWATNSPITVHDVASSPDYLEAIPGVVAEICVPVVVDGRAVGSLNVESLQPVSRRRTGAHAHVRAVARRTARGRRIPQRGFVVATQCARVGDDGGARRRRQHVGRCVGNHLRGGPAGLRVSPARRR